MYLLKYTLTKIDHLTLDQAKEAALFARDNGMGSEILSTDEAERRYLYQMQDLTKLEDWSQVK